MPEGWSEDDEREYDELTAAGLENAIRQGLDPVIAAEMQRGLALMKASYSEECSRFEGTISDETLEGMLLTMGGSIKSLRNKLREMADGEDPPDFILKLVVDRMPSPPTPHNFWLQVLTELRELRGQVAMYADLDRLNSGAEINLDSL
jgi:hypothetical protein